MPHTSPFLRPALAGAITAALLSVPALAADAREANQPQRAGVAIEPAHRAYVISQTDRSFRVDLKSVTWVVLEPPRVKVLMPGDVRQVQLDGGEAVDAPAARVPDATIYFPFAKANPIDGASVRELLPRALTANAIHVVGHTDAKGSEAYNLGLSQRRASTVSRMLVRGGVPVSRMQVEALGESRPADPTDDAKNRRVEITLETAE